ncbi:MAG: Holliday junction resolvase RuvX [bacterium]
MRLMGVDFGTRRVGLSVGETDPFFVEPLKTVQAADPAEAARRVAAEAESEGAEGLVVGLPTSLHGTADGSTAKLVSEFVRLVSGLVSVPVWTEDERFSTVMADRMHREYGTTSSRKFDRDALAAAIILETYIERLRSGRADMSGSAQG